MIYTTIFSFFFIALISSMINKKDKDILYLIYVVLIAFIIIFPFLVGINERRADFTNYLTYFLNSPKLTDSDLLYYATHSHYELGYSLFQAAIKTFINSATIFFIVLCLFSFVARYKFYARFCDIKELCILFFSFLAHEFLRKDCIQIRNGIASAIVLCSLYYLYKSDVKRFVVGIILACSFQMTAIVAFPLAFLKYEYSSGYFKILKYCFFFAIIFSIVFPLRKILVLLSGIGLIPSRVNVYLLWADYLTSMKITNPFLLKQILILGYVFIRKEKYMKDKRIFFLFEVYFVSTIYYLIFRDFEILAARFGSLFYATETPLLLLLINKRKKKKNYYRFFLVLMYFLIYFYNYLTFGNFLGWSPVFY